MDDQQIMPVGVGELVMRSPTTVLAEAEAVAKALAVQAKKLQLFKQIGPSKHLRIEGWQMVGAMFRVAARIRETKYVDLGEVHGYEAISEAFHIPTGQVISTAEGMCLSDEENWGLRPKYEYVNGQRVQSGLIPVPLQQLRSMAQTRACSKVLSNLFKWIAIMGGFAGTPAEEMPEQNGGAGEGTDEHGEVRRKSDSNGSAIITEKQASRIWGVAHGKNRSKDEVIAILKQFGFTTAKDVTTDKYEAIIAAIENTSSAAAPKQS